MQIVLGIVGVFAFAAWASAAIHALMLLGHVAPPRSSWSLLWQGWRFYDRSTFTESGQPIHRRFLISGAAFFGALVLGIACAVIATLLG